MNPKIRKSTLEDAEHFIRIKESLPLSTQNNHSQQGGFLLGTDIATYKFYISHGICFTAIASNEVVGFGIILPNELVKQSELWEKRKTVKWSIDLAKLESSNIAYLEQMAFLKGNRKLTLVLSYNLVHAAFKHGADYILTTTVKEPVANEAAIPLIKAVGGKKVGNIDEVYPQVGAINSDIYLIDKTTFYRSIKNLLSHDFLIANSL